MLAIEVAPETHMRPHRMREIYLVCTSSENCLCTCPLEALFCVMDHGLTDLLGDYGVLVHNGKLEKAFGMHS